MSSPFPDEAIVSDGRQPENNNAGAVSLIDMTGRLNGVLYMEDKEKTLGAEGADPTRHLADWFRHVPNASPLGLSAKDSYDVQRNDSWRGMAVAANGKHYYLLQTELRVGKLAPPNWMYDQDAAGWNEFVPELEALYGRIEFLKP
jgi:hypothetical protein